ncbi:SAM-dependent methyltransferase [Listeria newyorkensis]|uniref:Small RNA 2'-O-methyltransferase n=1 Tax=Listeria newyorkensis TaxID=1497681 RepID=A0ABX4XPQ5_9LIST|nr:class I SAM-dependent methyltransferase [Listeria newyorkensis]KGL41837.1 methyltransferase [Listeria newyorkensis]PNP94255.1 SAM-dependent methyltransferase [Listeria newyorkensis]WAO22668.1 class I SAM-dependent methyltransferase [Listeria newyorkensis]SQC51637.1 bifunctional 3-demethylubiquinone-9 3-methyltransferase/ 2-octaprenyl-6-hydroxy phenol methylase [Listeria newyorkensis]
MAIIQVKSTNPDFSFLIKKNPESGMMLRQMRKGIAHGWYSATDTYNVYFKDADNEISYKKYRDENFEYLNLSRYNSNIFPLNALGEFFSLKEPDSRDLPGFTHQFHINMFYIRRIHYVEFFQKYMPNYTFEVEHLSDKNWAVTISTKSSLYDLIHISNLFCLFFAGFSQEHLDITDDLLTKYIKSVQITDPPFYIRNLFVHNFLTTRRSFNQFKSELEATDRYDIQFDFGGTALQRRNFIAHQLSFDKVIVDIGCGEGFYAIPFAEKTKLDYYAIDIDPEMLLITNKKAEKKELDNIITYSSLETFLDNTPAEKVDVLLTEVIEHMPTNMAKKLIRKVTQHIDFDTFIITTPNSEFNTFYGLEGFRHDDHDWEMSTAEFQDWLSEIIDEKTMTLEFHAIGDAVNGIHTTQGAILRKKEV